LNIPKLVSYCVSLLQEIFDTKQNIDNAKSQPKNRTHRKRKQKESKQEIVAQVDDDEKDEIDLTNDTPPHKKAKFVSKTDVLLTKESTPMWFKQLCSPENEETSTVNFDDEAIQASIVNTIVIVLEFIVLFSSNDISKSLKAFWAIFECIYLMNGKMKQKLTEYYAKDIHRSFLKQVVNLVHYVITDRLANNVVTDIVRNAVDVLNLCWKVNAEYMKHHSDALPLLTEDVFINESVNSKIDINQDWIFYVYPNEFLTESNERQSIFAFCSFPFLLSASNKTRIIAQENQAAQRESQFNDVFVRNDYRAFSPDERYLIITVNRRNMIANTLHQISRNIDNVKKPLKIHFVNEEAVDSVRIL